MTLPDSKRRERGGRCAALFSYETDSNRGVQGAERHEPCRLAFKTYCFEGNSLTTAAVIARMPVAMLARGSG